MENFLRLQIVGHGGWDKGTVIDDVIPFSELQNYPFPENIIYEKFLDMQVQLLKHENDYTPELKKELGII